MHVHPPRMKPGLKLAIMVGTILAGAVVVFAWGQQLQADCLPLRGTSCMEDAVPNQLATAMAALGVGLVVIGLAMKLYSIGVNGWLEDLNARAGQPVSPRRRK